MGGGVVKLGELVRVLESRDPATVVRVGFTNPHSYRGDYSCVAFAPIAFTTIGAMLGAARAAVGETYEGYKGGEYVMGRGTECYLAYVGETGEMIGATLLGYMIGEPRMPGGWGDWSW